MTLDTFIGGLKALDSHASRVCWLDLFSKAGSIVAPRFFLRSILVVIIDVISSEALVKPSTRPHTANVDSLRGILGARNVADNLSWLSFTKSS